MKTTRVIIVIAFTVFASSTVICGDISTPPRRIPEGALTPEFSGIDTSGEPFTYTKSSGKVLILAFLSSQQNYSQEAVEDIFGVLYNVPLNRLTSLQIVFVMKNVDNSEFIASIQKDAPSEVHILYDDQSQIWGKFGIIAMPTVLISDSYGKVLCVKPGHAYDFAQVIKSKILQALEIPYEVSPDDASTVRILINDTMSAKAKRHLQMAKMLSEKNSIHSAIEQARIAYETDPNSSEVALELGELLCKAGQANEAIELVNSLSGQSNQEKARIKLIIGWAKRQLGQLEEAEKFLQEGIKQDPTYPRLYFELGRIYQERFNSEKAMQAYFQALQLIYNEE